MFSVIILSSPFATRMKPIEKLIIYDGICVLCNASVRRVLRNDKKKRFRVTALHTHTAKEQIALLASGKIIPDSILLIDHGKLYSKSTAVLRIARYMDNPWPFFYYSLIWIPAFIRNFFYDIVARMRYRWFGKHDACPLLPADLKDRLVDE